jgi:integration host factor subunit alpha
MTQDDIIDRLVLEVGLNRHEARDFVTIFFAEAKAMINEDLPVRLTGFGTLRKVKRSHRVRRDIPVSENTKPWEVVSFSPSKKALMRVQRALYEDERQEAIDQDRYAKYQEWLSSQKES